MLETITKWYRRYFTDPQAVLLAVLLVVGLTIVITMGNMLAPVFAAIVIAYLLEGVVRFIERYGAPRLSAVILTFLVFLAFLLFVVFGVVPLLSVQVTAFITEIPTYITSWQAALLKLPEQYTFITARQVNDLMAVIGQEAGDASQLIVRQTVTSIPGVITLAVYFILVPLLVFFFLKDKSQIIGWLSQFLPRERSAPSKVWKEMDLQLGNYVRGKFWEILILGGVSWVAFAILGLKYTVLLAVLVGLSAIIPYIGATVVTIPVAVVGYFQWGWSSEFAWLMGAYFVIQALDANVLVPLLFSEVVNLHPVAIIVSILVFGGLWGFWGVFFAIPLATLVNAILRSWPRVSAEAPAPAEAAT